MLASKQVNSTAPRPLYVTRDDIARFERQNPALTGIGEIMIRRGLWVVDGGAGGRGETRPEVVLNDAR